MPFASSHEFIIRVSDWCKINRYSLNIKNMSVSILPFADLYPSSNVDNSLAVFCIVHCVLQKSVH